MLEDTNVLTGSKRGPKPMNLSGNLDLGESTSKTATVAKHELHTVIRTLSDVPNGIDHFSGAEIDAYVGSFLSAGWELVSIHMLERRKDGTEFAFFLKR